jgi:cbb3-type cytochrome oxidase maturation protein
VNSLLLLIPLSILFLVGAGIALFWAVDHGQFDDMETPALLPLLDADRASTAVGRAGSTTADLGESAEPMP